MRYVSFREIPLKARTPVIIDHDTGRVAELAMITRIVEVIAADSETRTLTVELGGPLDRFCPPDQVGMTRTLVSGQWSPYGNEAPQEYHKARRVSTKPRLVK